MSKDTPNPIYRLIVVDDHPVFRQGLVQIISEEPDLKIAAEASSAPRALELIRGNQLDFAIVDIGLEGSANGIELTKSIRAEHPNLPILILSMYDESLYGTRALRAGARGYLMKREAASSVILAIRTILRGEIYVSAALEKQLVAAHAMRPGGGSSPIERLTDRELEVLHLFGIGRDVREIAKALHISAKTVDAHRGNIKQKLLVKNARELTRYAIDWVNTRALGPVTTPG